MRCPLCKVFDPLLNVCADPCLEYGDRSSDCKQFGCPGVATSPPSASSVEVYGVGQWLVPGTVSAALLIAFCVVVVVVLFKIFTIHRRQNEGENA